VKVKLILPALTEATSPLWRPIKYSLFPPLGLATLAAYLGDDDDAEIQDEHVERLDLEDVPDLVVIQVYITSAYRAYRIADHYRRRGAYLVMGGLHVTSLPDEAAAHADTIFLGPGEDTWPQFLADFRRGAPARVYRSQVRTLGGGSRHPPRPDQAATLSGAELDRRLARLPAREVWTTVGGPITDRAIDGSGSSRWQPHERVRFAILVGTLFGAPVVPLRPATLLGDKPGQHDEDPHEPEQREERDASSTPIDCAKYVQTQADQTGGAEDTVDASVNSHT
jgi:radical SAM superfamily enzyme YgiQ (UPF0313 family)